MLKFAANVSLLYPEHDFLDRFAAAARDGFTAVEFQFPYVHQASAIARRLDDASVAAILFNMPAGDVLAGERGIACLPDRVGEFRAGVGTAIAYARTLGCRQLNCLAGIAPGGLDRAAVRATLIANLRFAAAEFERAGLTLLVEPINTRDVPGFALSTSSDALRIIEAVGSTNVKLQYDVYHMQRMEGELAATLEANLARIGHIQIADTPGRHEPGTGEINYRFLFGHLARIGYDRWIGCEYVPIAGTSAGLRWLRDSDGLRDPEGSPAMPTAGQLQEVGAERTRVERCAE